jgi:Fic family protein
MIPAAGTCEKSTTLGEDVNAFVPFALPPSAPRIDPQSYEAFNRKAEMALDRLFGVSGLVPSVDWLLYRAIRKEALLTSRIEGTQATITDLFDEEAGLDVSNTDDVEDVTNYIAAYKLVRENLGNPKGLPIRVRLMCEAHKLLLNGVRVTGKQPGDLRRSQIGLVEHVPATLVLCHLLQVKFQGYSVTWKNYP